MDAPASVKVIIGVNPDDQAHHGFPLLFLYKTFALSSLTLGPFSGQCMGAVALSP